jgi:hypothetical protein
VCNAAETERDEEQPTAWKEDGLTGHLRSFFNCFNLLCWLNYESHIIKHPFSSCAERKCYCITLLRMTDTQKVTGTCWNNNNTLKSLTKYCFFHRQKAKL